MHIGRHASDVLLRDQNLAPYGLLWLFDDRERDWRFVVATRDVVRNGPRSAYRRIRAALKRAGLLEALPLSRVLAVAPNDQLVQGVATAIRGMFPEYKRKPIENATLKNYNLGDGNEMTNVFVYRININ